MKKLGFILLILGSSLANDDIYYPPQFTKGNRIVGGSECPKGIAPYQVSLQYYGVHNCGGALISRRWVLTASHCVSRKSSENLEILTGTQNLKIGGKLYSVDLIKTHPEHNNPHYHNDIALVRLSEPVELNEDTQTIDYDTDPLPENKNVTLRLTGWGYMMLGGVTPDKLQLLDVGYVTYVDCKKAHYNSPWVGEDHVCTYNQKGEGACHGDSGGPLTYKNKLAALVNWGRPCAQGYPDAHARVSFFKLWITQTMAENS